MITKEEVIRIAALARIRLTPEETGRFEHDFAEILNYFAKLQEVDTEKVAPMTHSGIMSNVTRQDVAVKQSSFVIEKLLAMAQGLRDGFVRVQSILKKG